MFTEGVFAAVLAARLRRRPRHWSIAGTGGLDDHLRRDIGLPPRVVASSTMLAEWR